MTHDRTNGPPPSGKVIRKISDAEGVSPTEIDPLFESIDPDHLDAIFQNVTDGPNRSDGKVVFSHEGYEVTVEADSTVWIND